MCIRDRGYIVESRRGGGGYIRITRIAMDPKATVMHVVNAIGNSLDSASARAMLLNLKAVSYTHLCRPLQRNTAR